MRKTTHPEGHEVSGVVSGHARVLPGGPGGLVVEVNPGDVGLLPAGTGHCDLGSSADFVVVGAYPPSQAQLEQVACLSFPAQDPVQGNAGTLRD